MSTEAEGEYIRKALIMCRDGMAVDTREDKKMLDKLVAAKYISYTLNDDGRVTVRLSRMGREMQKLFA